MTHNTINQAMTGHVLIAGSSGTGKSYFAGGLFELLHQQKTPYVILDTKSQNHLGIWIGKNRLKGLQLFRIFPDTNHTIEEYKKLLKKNPLPPLHPGRRNRLRPPNQRIQKNTQSRAEPQTAPARHLRRGPPLLHLTTKSHPGNGMDRTRRPRIQNMAMGNHTKDSELPQRRMVQLHVDLCLPHENPPGHQIPLSPNPKL